MYWLDRLKNWWKADHGLTEYEIQDKLGEGAFSDVYKAKHKLSGDEVAIKVIRKYELNKQQKSSVLKEVELMRTIDHPSIIRLISFIESKQYYYLVLELMNGGELFQQIVHLTYFSEDLARHCFQQIAQSIHYLHVHKGIVHRDIKPENILFEAIPLVEQIVVSNNNEPKIDEGVFTVGVGGGGIGRVKIADFGLSKVIWDKETMSPCGTIGYTAPEIVRDQWYSSSVDLWALGCVLYTMLCGFPPFFDENTEGLTRKVVIGEYEFMSPWWDHVSSEAKDLVSHLLHINPKKRYTIQQCLLHPWMTKKLELRIPPPLPTTSVVIETAQSIPRYTPPSVQSHLLSIKKAFDVSTRVHLKETESPLLLDLNQATLISKRKKSKGGH